MLSNVNTALLLTPFIHSRHWRTVTFASASSFSVLSIRKMPSLRRITDKTKAFFRRIKGAGQPTSTQVTNVPTDYTSPHAPYSAPSHVPDVRNFDIQQQILPAPPPTWSQSSSPAPAASPNGAPSYFGHASDFVIQQQNINNLGLPKTIFECTFPNPCSVLPLRKDPCRSRTLYLTWSSSRLERALRRPEMRPRDKAGGPGGYCQLDEGRR